MCSHLQRKLFEEDGVYHRVWLAMQDDPELTAVVRSRQLHVYRNGKKVLVLAGKSAPKVIRKDSICEMLYDTKPMITLVPFQESDREQFILDNQRAFKYGAMEEMTKQREQSQACLSFAESRRNSSEAQFGMRDDRMEEGEEVISRKTIERSIDGEQAETYRIVCDD